LVVGRAGRWSGRGRPGSCFPLLPTSKVQIWLALAQEQHLTGTPSNQIGSRVAVGSSDLRPGYNRHHFSFGSLRTLCAYWFSAACAARGCVTRGARDARRRSSPPFRDVQLLMRGRATYGRRRRTASWPCSVSLRSASSLSSDHWLTRPGCHHLMSSAGGLTRIGGEPADHGCTTNGRNICTQISDAIRPDAE
jgi:hypothetical protein